MSQFRWQFPYFNTSDNGTFKGAIEKPLYFDSAATTQRLQSVLDAIEQYHLMFNSNVHRGGYSTAVKATNEFEQARSTLANFIGAASDQQIVFTSGATEAINMIANGLSIDMLHGHKILVCESEHHANLLPWQALAKRFGLQIEAIKLGKDGVFEEPQLESAMHQLTDDVALIAIAQVSNVLGNIFPVATLCKKARQVGALSVIDGTQAAAHIRIDVQKIACDFYALSGHKMYATTGTGLFYGRSELLEQLQPSKLGGEMVKEVSLNNYTTQAPPLKFEAGTANVSGIIGWSKAAQFCQQNLDLFHDHEQSLYQLLVNNLQTIDGLRILGNHSNSIATVSFIVDDWNVQDFAMELQQKNIAVRAGQHCAMPLFDALEITACIRISIACYNTQTEIEQLISAIKSVCQSKEQFNQDEQRSKALELNNIDKANSNQAKSDKAQLNLYEKALSAQKGWNAKHRIILLQSKFLPVLAKVERVSANAINGCEAKVWLKATKSSDNQLQLFAYSDSKVVRGLLTLLILKAHTMTLQENVSFDWFDYLQVLDLSRYFSQGRRDGMSQVIGTIKKHCEKLMSI